MMTDYQRETAFLKHLILYDETVERHKLEERISQAQREERCVRRAIWLMALMTAVAIAGICYSGLFLDDFPRNRSQTIIKVFSVLGLTSLISLLAFVIVSLAYRRTLHQRREECRRMVVKLLESRLGKPRTSPLPGFLKDQEIVVRRREIVASTAEIVDLPHSRRRNRSFS